MQEVQAKLRETVKSLFGDGRVELVIGYEQGSLPMTARPAFISAADPIDRLVWNAFCTNNLAVFLPRLFERPANPRQEFRPPKVGIVAKACDARSIVALRKENQLVQENVVVVGVPCTGMVDAGRIRERLGAEVAQCREREDGKLEVTSAAGEKTVLPVDDVLQQACEECPQPAPRAADVSVEGESRAPSAQRYRRLRQFEAMPAEQRWAYFREQIAKCIRCSACRQACPTCYCKYCFADQAKPRWVGAGADLSDAMLFHIGRLMHQAGRCVECDACFRACPMNVDLRTLTRVMGKGVQELFDYVSGVSPDEPPLLCTAKKDDNEDFVTANWEQT
ncbi:MAG: Coenzyme F420 hydrogenase/dehydrogenase, beta subunit C-terminal domain [Kiritimatiellae bacterium]|nr:Coenzyme F420 hydrogenase/dehydrogenase, beta subunit C-terminal domain [Kiritimatiellia bacterium]